MNFFKYLLCRNIDGALIKGSFTETCILELSEVSKEALRAGRLKLVIEQHGGKAPLQAVIISIAAKSGNISISIAESQTTVAVGENCFGKFNFSIWGRSNVQVGRDTSSNGCRVICDYGDVSIGEDCMLADNIILQCGDQHGLVDISTGKIINDGRSSIVVEDHVWLARQTTLLNGTHVQSGSIVGLGSVVAKGEYGPNSLLLGIPAKIVKNDCTWSRSTKRLDSYSSSQVNKYSENLKSNPD